MEGELDDFSVMENDNRNASQYVNWQHPIFDPGNIILNRTVEPMRGVDDDTQTQIIENIASGNDPFFHIEHLLEVRGPMASIGVYLCL